MAEEANRQKMDLSEVMLTMDVVDTLRHQKSLVERELRSEEHDRELVEKVRKIYAEQGLEVSEDIVARGVEALREDRFTYQPPRAGFRTRLARLYVNRAKWTQRAFILIFGLLAVYLAYQFAYVMPAERERARVAKESEALPEKLASLRALALEEALEVGVSDRIETMYRDGITALESSDVQGAREVYEALRQLNERLRQEYVLQIVSRPGTPSGVWRYPVDNPSGRNYYLILEAISPGGKALALPVTSEEDGKTSVVSVWGQRVDRRTYEAVVRDKQADGIVDRKRFGVKKRGYLTLEYDMPTAGGAITAW
jgi:hypothetical protein